MVSKPTLGFASKSKAIIAMRDEQKMTFKDIADTLGLPNRQCRSLYWQSVQIASGNPVRTTLSLDRQLTKALKPHADRRGLNTPGLARAIIAAVVKGKMIDRILKDFDKTLDEAA